MGCQSKIPVPIRPPSTRITAYLLALLAVACTADTASVEVDTGPRDLGPESFTADAFDDVPDDLEEVGDVADAADVDDETGRGQPCDLLTATCEGGLKCVPGPEGNATCQPLPAAPRQVGEVCGQRGEDDCAAGLLCYATSDSPDELRCHQLCDPAAGSACPDGSACEGPLAWLQAPVGVCAGGNR